MSTFRITTDVLEIACEAGGADIAVARTRTTLREVYVIGSGTCLEELGVSRYVTNI